jgi:hypothetical protein
LTFAIHVIRGFSENTSTGSLGTLEKFVDARDTKMDGVRPGPLQCGWGRVGVCARGREDDGAVLVYELAAILRIAETFGKWQGRGEPLNRFAHFGIVKNWYDTGVRCRTVLLEHMFRGYQCLLWSSNEKEISHGRVSWQTR